jgi:hypothetical protein
MSRWRSQVEGFSLPPITIGLTELFAMARTLDAHRFLFTKHPETGPLPRLPSPGNGRHLIREIDTVHETP